VYGVQDPRGGEGGARLGRVVHERASGKHGHEFFSQISMVMMVMKVPKADMVINVPRERIIVNYQRVSMVLSVPGASMKNMLICHQEAWI
jgi:hypothetical protein